MTCVCEQPLTQTDSPLWDALVATRYNVEPGAPTSDVLETIKDTTLGDVSLELPSWYPAESAQHEAPPSDYDSDQETDQEQGEVNDSSTGGG